jgi:hypothetical protein
LDPQSQDVFGTTETVTILTRLGNRGGGRKITAKSRRTPREKDRSVLCDSAV